MQPQVRLGILVPNGVGVLPGVLPRVNPVPSFYSRKRKTLCGSSLEGVTLEKRAPLDADKDPVRSEIPVSILLFN